MHITKNKNLNQLNILCYRKEEWRIWEVDKMEKKELLMFPVSRIEWDRISNLHVSTHLGFVDI